MYSTYIDFDHYTVERNITYSRAPLDLYTVPTTKSSKKCLSCSEHGSCIKSAYSMSQKNENPQFIYFVSTIHQLL